MTTPHSGRRIEPLPPPPGSFDAVLNRARARRYHRLTAVTGVAAVFLAGIMGGLAMGGGVSGVQDSIISAATGGLGGDDVPTPASSESSDQPAPSTSTPDASQSSPDTTATAETTPVRRLQVRGRVVDGGGDPVGGLFVYTGTVSAKVFVPTSSAPAAITGIRGAYSVPCTDGPVLITSWELNLPQGLYADGKWAATLVKNVDCAYAAPRKVTEVSPGATVMGNVFTDAACADDEFPLWLWLGGHRTTAVRLSQLSSGDGFLVSGLPKGTHILTARGDRTKVTVGPSGTVRQDIEVPCPDAPPDGPTSSPDPTPTPDPTVTPDPIETPPDLPSPTP
jgi:hypothetical protein